MNNHAINTLRYHVSGAIARGEAEAVTAIDKTTGRHPGSYIILDRKTGEPVCELFTVQTVRHINTGKYAVMTAGEYLARFNRAIKQKVTP